MTSGLTKCGYAGRPAKPPAATYPSEEIEHFCHKIQIKVLNGLTS